MSHETVLTVPNFTEDDSGSKVKIHFQDSSLLLEREERLRNSIQQVCVRARNLSFERKLRNTDGKQDSLSIVISASNGNRTEWSLLRSVIIRVINKIGCLRSRSLIMKHIGLLSVINGGIGPEIPLQIKTTTKYVDQYHE